MVGCFRAPPNSSELLRTPPSLSFRAPSELLRTPPNYSELLRTWVSELLRTTPVSELGARGRAQLISAIQTRAGRDLYFVKNPSDFSSEVCIFCEQSWNFAHKIITHVSDNIENRFVRIHVSGLLVQLLVKNYRILAFQRLGSLPGIPGSRAATTLSPWCPIVPCHHTGT